MQLYTSGFLPDCIWWRQSSQELKSVPGNVCCRFKDHKEQMQIDSHLSGAASVPLLRNYVSGSKYFSLIFVLFNLRAAAPRAEGVISEPTVPLHFSQERIRAIISIALHVQFIPALRIISAAQSLGFWKFSNLSNRHNKRDIFDQQNWKGVGVYGKLCN